MMTTIANHNRHQRVVSAPSVPSHRADNQKGTSRKLEGRKCISLFLPQLFSILSSHWFSVSDCQWTREEEELPVDVTLTFRLAAAALRRRKPFGLPPLSAETIRPLLWHMWQVWKHRCDPLFKKSLHHLFFCHRVVINGRFYNLIWESAVVLFDYIICIRHHWCAAILDPSGLACTVYTGSSINSSAPSICDGTHPSVHPDHCDLVAHSHLPPDWQSWIFSSHM